jgi:hemerythrin-like domain-containing protein
MTPLPPPPDAGFDHPLEMLGGCHARIRRNCGVIQEVAERLAAGPADAAVREAARGVVRFFDTAGVNHHRDEEQDLFPALVQFVPAAELNATRALIARLRADHARLEVAWSQMREPLLALATGGDAAIGTGAASRFATAFDRHILLEESQLLPLARRVLDARLTERIGQRMARRHGVARPAA